MSGNELNVSVPVAWRWRSNLFRDWSLCDKSPIDQLTMERETETNMEGLEWEALYASPQPVTKPAMGGGWMPIETAPRDGEWIDVWVVNPDRTGGGSRSANVRWSDDAWRETNGFSVEGFFDAVTNIPLIRVSHWMPLPAPPATTGGEEL